MNTGRRPLIFAALVTACLLSTFTGRSQSEPAAPDFQPKKLNTRHLPNAWQLDPKVISGGQPTGRERFAELRDLGVRTVISVDGARPDVETAHTFGLRYVHLPHGYDGISASRTGELAKAVRDLPGPIYVHCHHGKHRSAAAAAVACIATGRMQRAAATKFLKEAGTDPHYRGLYEAVSRAEPLTAAEINRVRSEFQEIEPIPPLAESMVAIDELHSRLELAAQARWQPSTEHPDVNPAHEALLLREHFTELSRSDDSAHRPARFRELLALTEAEARRIESALRSPYSSGHTALSPNDVATAALSRLSGNCRACHEIYRDNEVPLP